MTNSNKFIKGKKASGKDDPMPIMLAIGLGAAVYMLTKPGTPTLTTHVMSNATVVFS